MRFSSLIIKTSKETPAGESYKNAQLLIRAGYIHKEMAGVYSFLPLGLMVLNNIVEIIRQEMNAIGGQELLLTALQDPKPWQQTGQWSDDVVDVWFKTRLKNGKEIGLSYTHEAAITRMMTKIVSSHKDLPLYPYQFQTKFRNELRAKSGLLRTREFMMKDLYSFDLDETSHKQFYEKAKEAYIKIFERIGIGEQTYLTFASGGTFSRFSHEFQTVCEAGEDIIYISHDKKLAVNKEVLDSDVLSDLGLNRDDLEEAKAAEVGNIFNLGTKYSEPLGLFYTDENGERKPVYMGSYGIGPGRVMGVVSELMSDDKGLVWPDVIAPFDYYLIVIGDDEQTQKFGEEVYQKLTKVKSKVLFDDRAVSVGQKFADADLLGIPKRLVISNKTNAMIECKRRSSEDTALVEIDQLEKL